MGWRAWLPGFGRKWGLKAGWGSGVAGQVGVLVGRVGSWWADVGRVASVGTFIKLKSLLGFVNVPKTIYYLG